MGLVSELKRRNVFRMAVLYVIAAWLIMQVAEVVIGLANLPDLAGPMVLAVLAIGFPIALVFSWLYELTPEGLTLEKDVVRSQSITNMTGRRMDFIVISLLAAAVLMFAIDKWWKGSPEESSIALLPFENLSLEPEQQFFTDGIHDEILTRLSQIGNLSVISRTSVMPYRDSVKSLPDIAQELSVASIVEGGVQRAGNKVRVNVQLIDAQSDEHLWAETYDRELTTENLFAVQSDVAKSIAKALHANLTPKEDLALGKHHTKDLAAYDAYLAGRVMLDSAATSDVEEAVEQFSRATRIDPDFAAAWAGLCEAYLILYQKISDLQFFDNAKSACTRSLELDDSRAEVHIAVALLYSTRGQYSHAEVSLQRANFAKAEQALDNAVELDRLSIQAQIDLGYVYAHQGRLEEAETKLKDAAEADPRNWQAHTALFSFYYRDSELPNRFELAAHHAAIAAALRPDLSATWNNLGSANYMLARYDQAANAWQQAATIEPNRTSYTNTGIALYNANRFEEAADMQRKAIEIAPNDHRAWGRLGDALRFVDREADHAADAYTKATNLAREQLAVNDQFWRTWGLLATYLARNNQTEDAIIAAERALHLAGRNSESLYYAAVVMGEIGRDSDCLDLLEEAIVKDPAYREFVKIDPDFRRFNKVPRFQDLFSR